MFDIGWSEILIIVVVAIVVVGPKDLPRLMGTFGRYAGKLRRAAADFQRQFDDAIRETEVAEVKKAMETVRAEAASLDQPVMLPKLETPAASPAQTPAPPTPVQEPPPAPLAPAATSPEQTKPKPARKSRASTKPKAASKTSGAKRGNAKAEPPHDG